jgi:3-hydroxyisobutyrate dehydrogenase
MTSKDKVAFVGLGVMGYPMAGHLVKNGYDVTVFNRTVTKADQWVSEFGGAMATSPAAAATDASYIFTCVGNDDDLRSVVVGDNGVFSGMNKGACLVDHTTTSAIVAREISDSAENQGLEFLDAPVSGGQAGAENGALTVMVGGDPKIFDSAKPAMDCYGKAVTLMGPSGAGQLTKMVNQICIAGLVQALSEAMNFAQRAGLDGEQVLDVISKGAAQSWQPVRYVQPDVVVVG